MIIAVVLAASKSAIQIMILDSSPVFGTLVALVVLLLLARLVLSARPAVAARPDAVLSPLLSLN